MPGYTDDELARLRSVIVELRTVSESGIREVGRAVAEGRCSPHLAPFWSLQASGARSCSDRSLFDKLAVDPLVLDFSCFAFFPCLYPRLYFQGERPQIWFDGRTRGRVALFRFAEGEGLVVKPLQSGREAEIACLAGEAGVGPRQLPSLAGFLTEELVEGRFFTDFAAGEMDDELGYQVGRRLGAMLSTLHQAGICYNDATLSDPEGRSHLLVRLPGQSDAAGALALKLIDFGVSVLLDKFPDLEPEEVFNLVRTTPEYRLLSRMGLQGNELAGFLGQYRQRVSAVSKEEILARDLRFAEEGLQQAARRLGAGIIATVRQGLADGYGE